MKTATEKLSKRELEIAELIAWGSSKKEIAAKLFISERTVESHTLSAFRKIGVTKSNELAAWWFCEHYNIPKTESPLLKKMHAGLAPVACALSALLCYL